MHARCCENVCCSCSQRTQQAVLCVLLFKQAVEKDSCHHPNPAAAVAATAVPDLTLVLVLLLSLWLLVQFPWSSPDAGVPQGCYGWPGTDNQVGWLADILCFCFCC
jgi:hypothetical protein